MRSNFELKFGASICLLIAAMSLLSFFWVPYDYNAMNHENRLRAPTAAHIFGTDNFGRDIFSRVALGARNSLVTAICVVALAAAAGTIIGLLAGYLGGITDAVVTRIIDTISSFPGVILALLFVAVMENSQFTLFITLFILFTPSFTRVTRNGAARYRNADFIQAEKAMGAGFFRITVIHILPNLYPSLLSACVLGLSNAILMEASMSYLGIGIQPPLPSWGRMLFESQSYFFSAPWCAIFPGIFVTLTVFAFHFTGEGLRQRFGE